MNEWEDLDVNEFDWEELDVNEVFGLINNNVPNPSPELRDQLYGLITETQNLVIEINEEPRQTELEEAVLAEREACAKLVEADGLARGAEGLVFIKAAGRIRARGEKPPVKTYAGGKPNYCTPVDGVNMTQDRVDETAKGEHEPVGWLDSEGRFSYFKHLDSDEPLYTAPPVSDYHEGWEEGFKAAKRDSSSWVGLTHEERDEIDQNCRSQMEALFAIEAKLKEKNT